MFLKEYYVKLNRSALFQNNNKIKLPSLGLTFSNSLHGRVRLVFDKVVLSVLKWGKRYPFRWIVLLIVSVKRRFVVL